MDKLKKVVYQFLDGYVGDGINVETETRPTYDPLPKKEGFLSIYHL